MRFVRWIDPVQFLYLTGPNLAFIGSNNTLEAPLKESHAVRANLSLPYRPRLHFPIFPPGPHDLTRIDSLAHRPAA
jgi:hypothetical protein